MKKIYLLIIIIVSTATTMFAQGTGCPSVTAISVATNTGSITMPCTATCTDLSASAFNVGETNIYTVNSIPHSPPIAYNQAGGTAISVNSDDVWSGLINLPFPFCFFGDTYTQVKIGSNGAIKLGPTPLTGGGYHPWPFSASVPSPDLVDAGNIFGVYHDIDPTVAGTVRWYLLGSAPCRTLVVSFNNLGHYSCTSLRSTHMMVLYETTNVIEVYVQNKATCTGWNGGRAVIGIQNNTGTVGYTPPGRNTGNWTVTTPEAWRFTPAGAPIYTAIQWLEGATPIGSGNTITVCPSGNTTYTARTTYTRCDGLQIQAQDQVAVSFSPNPVVNVSPQNPFSCSGQSILLSASANMPVNYNWSTGATTASVNVSPASTTTYTVTATDPTTGCTGTASTTVNISQPISTACNVLYVTPTGSSFAPGTRANPMDLSTALRAGACNGTIIKMSTGTYTTDTTITGVTSYLTLEGGFNAAVNWEKVSTMGATTILKTATLTTSTTAGRGITDEAGADPRSVAMEVSSQTGFRFQDLTIQVSSLATGSPILGYRGVSTVGVRLNNCSAYNIVRTRINVGAASPGSNEGGGAAPTVGGSSFGLYLVGNGAGGNVISSNVTAGAAGLGGEYVYTNPGVRVAPGISEAVRWISGSGLAVTEIVFNLAGQTTIRMDDISCTFTNIGYRSPASNSWDFGLGSNPSTATAQNATTQYSTLGRKDITYGGSPYIGFANIISEDQVLPTFTTSVPFIQGQYRICVGETASFTATNGGLGYIYVWDIDGYIASSPTLSTLSFPFPTPGIYPVTLRYETSCCGLSDPTTINIYVEDQPLAVASADQQICFGATVGVDLSVTGFVAGGSIEWSPATGLNGTTTATVTALPTSTTTYTVALSDSTGLCTSSDQVTVTVIDLLLTPSSTTADCFTPGTASVAVSGGSGNYSYAWSNGGGANSINNLQPGDYGVTVTDNTNGCVDSLVVNVPAGPGALVGTISSTDITCAGEDNGTVTMTVSGGTSPYTYTWSPIGGTTTTASTSQTITDLPQGTYSVNVRDASGCEYDAVAEVNEPSPIVMIIDSVRAAFCEGIEDGFIRVQSDGGERPYSYTWSNGMAVNIVNDGVNADNLGAGTYVLTLTDAFGCQDSVSVTVLALNTYTGIVDTTICFRRIICV
jgi:large repetitive protein